MQYSVLTRQAGHTVHRDKVCLTISCMHAHPVQGLASLRTLDYDKHHTTHALATAHTLPLTLQNADQHKTFAAAGVLDSHVHTNDPESFTDPML